MNLSSAPHWHTHAQICFPECFPWWLEITNHEFIRLLSFKIKVHVFFVCVFCLSWWNVDGNYVLHFLCSASMQRTFPSIILIRSAVGKISGTLVEWGRGISYETIVAHPTTLSRINNETRSDALGKPWERIRLRLIQVLSPLAFFAAWLNIHNFLPKLCL